MLAVRSHNNLQSAAPAKLAHDRGNAGRRCAISLGNKTKLPFMMRAPHHQRMYNSDNLTSGTGKADCLQPPCLYTLNRSEQSQERDRI